MSCFLRTFALATCILLSTSLSAETPLISANGAEVSDSGTSGLCLLCSISNVENLVSNNLTSQTTMSLPVGVAGSTFVCVTPNRVIPAGRRAGFVANLNDGVLALLEGSTLVTRLNGSVQESLSGPGFLLTLIGIGGSQNVAGSFTQPFDEICYQTSSVLSLLSIYRVNYAFVLEASATESTLAASPTSITANGTATSVITVETRDSLGELLPGGGDTVELTTTAGALSAVTDNGDGTYTATLTASTAPETATISATINGQPIDDTATVNFVVDQGSEPSAALSGLNAAPDLVEANGSDSAVISIQARDVFGNDFSVGGATVTVAATVGTVSAVTDNGDGTYTATVVSTEPGEATITGTLEGETIGESASVTFFDPNAPHPGNSELSAFPTSITANGTSQAVITVTARNAAGDPIDTGSVDIVLATTAGTLATTVTYLGDGVYRAILTSSMVEETALITAMLDGQLIDETATVDFVNMTGGGIADPDATRLSAEPTAIDADGMSTSVITVEARDSFGNPIGTGGDTVVLDATLGGLSEVTDLGDGRYTATLTAASMVGTNTITGTINGDPIGQSATVEFRDDLQADASQSMIEANPDTLPADGMATAIITVTAHDADGNPLTVGGDSVAIETTLGTLGTTVTDNGDGTYSAVLTAPTEPGTAIVTGFINGVPISMTTEITFFDPNQADPGNSLIEAVPAQITANGLAQSVITITARNAAGEPTNSGGDIVTVATTAGSLSSTVTDLGDGRYTTVLTSSTTEESALIAATINGEMLSNTVTVDFVDASGGGADPNTSRVSAIPSVIANDGVDTSLIVVEARDAFGNAIDQGGDIVTLQTTLGELSAVSDLGDGTYTATLTGTAIGSAEISGTLNGEALTDTATVTFRNEVQGDASQSIIRVTPNQLPADGISTALITVEVRDTNGTPLTVGGDTVALETTLGTLGTTVTDNGDGTYSALITAPGVPGVGLIGGTLNGVPIANDTSIIFGDGLDDIFRDRFEH